jgi:hypothetical protein
MQSVFVGLPPLTLVRTPNGLSYISFRSSYPHAGKLPSHGKVSAAWALPSVIAAQAFGPDAGALPSMQDSCGAWGARYRDQGRPGSLFFCAARKSVAFRPT